MQIDLNKLDPDKRQQVAELLGIDLDKPEEPKKRQAKKLPKILKSEQLEKLFAVMNLDTVNGVKQRAVIGVMLKAGLRVSEVCNLTIADVDFTKGSIYVQLGKGGKDRVIPMGAELIEWLREWADISPESQWFFCTRNGTQAKDRNVRELCYLLSKKAGVYIQDGPNKRPFHPHNLRHTCATNWLNSGLSVRDVQELLGHSSIATSERYLHIDNVALDKKIKDLG